MTTKITRLSTAVVAALAAFAASGASLSTKAQTFDEQAVKKFYENTRLRMVVGYGPGGGYDTWARLISRYISKHIPGNPTVIVENKPGAGGLIAANALYSSEPKDGSVMATFTMGHVLQQALGNKRIKFDGRKFNWLASASHGDTACVVRTDVGIKNIRDVMGGKALALAAQAPGNSTYDTPKLLNEMIGTNFKPITGYTSVPEMLLAVRNKEASGICIGYTSVILPNVRDLLEGPNPKLKPIIVMGDKPLKRPFLDTSVPPAETLAKDPTSRRMLKAVRLSQEPVFNWATAPGVPKDRVAALRMAFKKTFEDPGLVREAKRAGQNLEPITGEELQAIATEVLSTPPDLVAKLKKILRR